MKKISYIICFLFIIIFTLNARQSSIGIYRSYNDFKIRKISVQANCKSGKRAVQISNFFLRPYVYIRTDSGKIKIHEDSIYAVQDYKGNIHRIWNRNEYLLVDTGKLRIYSYSYTGTIKARTSKGVRSEYKPMTGYCFSVDDTSAIVPLTVTNVRLALLTNKKLDALLRCSFPNNASLQSKQDSQFEINHFISNNLNLYEK